MTEKQKVEWRELTNEPLKGNYIIKKFIKQNFFISKSQLYLSLIGFNGVNDK